MRTPTSSNAYYPLFFFVGCIYICIAFIARLLHLADLNLKKLKHKNNAALKIVTECSLRVAVTGRLTLTIPIQNEVLHNVLLAVRVWKKKRTPVGLGEETILNKNWGGRISKNDSAQWKRGITNLGFPPQAAWAYTSRATRRRNHRGHRKHVWSHLVWYQRWILRLGAAPAGL